MGLLIVFAGFYCVGYAVSDYIFTQKQLKKIEKAHAANQAALPGDYLQWLMKK